MEELAPNVDTPGKPLRFRWIRIAKSIFFGAVTVALIVTWLRSDNSGGYIYWNLWKHRSVLVGLSNGQAVVHTELFTMGEQRLCWISPRRASLAFRWRPLPTSLGRRIWNGFQFVLPIWCVTAVPALIATASWPWCSPRFSLRTLLIATTLVAVVLGLAGWQAG
jgi:hypothetical protein